MKCSPPESKVKVIKDRYDDIIGKLELSNQLYSGGGKVGGRGGWVDPLILAGN